MARISNDGSVPRFDSSGSQLNCCRQQHHHHAVSTFHFVSFAHLILPCAAGVPPAAVSQLPVVARIAALLKPARFGAQGPCSSAPVGSRRREVVTAPLEIRSGVRASRPQSGGPVLKDNAMTSKPSLYDTVTQSVIAAIEAKPGKPAMPWHRDATAPLFMPENALTKKSYQGINTLVLWVSAEQQGFKSPVWATYRQFAELGCQVRRNEKSTPVVFYKLCG